MTHTHPSKKRPAGDGMDTEIEDPELIYGLPDHTRDCQCACDKVVYAPGYTTCLQVIVCNYCRLNPILCVEGVEEVSIAFIAAL